MEKVTVYKFQPKTGFNEKIFIEELNNGLKIFSVYERLKKMYNTGFFIIQSEIDEDKYTFTSIKIVNGFIKVINHIEPNTVDKDLLIDAIFGCKIPDNIFKICTDRIIDRIVSRNENGELVWDPETKTYLNKVNIIRLNEIYQKLKS